MSQEQQPTQFDRSPEFLVAEVAHQWVSGIDRSVGNAEIHMNKGQKIDPEKGLFHDILEIRVTRQMDKVQGEVTAPALEPLPPIPPPQKNG